MLVAHVGVYMLKKVKYFLQYPNRLPVLLITKLPYFRFIRETKDYQCHISFQKWFLQKVFNLGSNRQAYWPVHFTSRVYSPEHIMVGIDAYPGYMGGCYIQGMGGITIGDYTQIAPNVALISANHDLYDSRLHIEKPIIIGKYCWLGVGVKIMPGVTLGDFTIVAAGAVVTKSFEEGYCVIGGIPAVTIKKLDKEKCIPFHNAVAYNGYIRSNKFDAYRKKKLKI